MGKNILIIGASGRLGIEAIHVLAKHSLSPSVHAFVRTPSKLPSETADLCASIQKGDALRSADITRALEKTKADTIILSIGVPNSTAASDVREKSAKALMEVLKPDGMFDHVRLVCVSSIGAGGTKIIIGMGLGTLVYFRLRKVLQDHDRQEEIFISGMGSAEGKRLLIVRPVGLSNKKATGKVKTFGDQETVPSSSISRADVALYMAEQIFGEAGKFGGTVNVATGK